MLFSFSTKHVFSEGFEPVYLQVEVWVQLLSTMGELFSLLEEHPEVHFVEGLPEEEENLEVRVVIIDESFD